MRLAPTICHIGEVGTIVRTGRISHARHLFPRRRANCGETGVAVRPGVHFGDFQPIGAVLMDEWTVCRLTGPALAALAKGGR
jgi:hypothetical protein